jgi:hypothetical protein
VVELVASGCVSKVTVDIADAVADRAKVEPEAPQIEGQVVVVGRARSRSDCWKRARVINSS